MADVTIKSTGALIDELITINMKIFWALEKAEKARRAGKAKKVGKHYSMAQAMNSKRGQLIRAIDRRLGESDISITEKTF